MAQAKVRYEKWSRKPLFGRRQYYWEDRRDWRRGLQQRDRAR